MRSPLSLMTGVNLQKIDGPRLSDLNLRSYVLYDESAAFAPELRRRVPDALIALRLIQNSNWTNPEWTARQGARLCAAFPQVDILCPGNEQNFENRATPEGIALWCDRFNDEWARLGAPKPTVSPALSPGAPFSLSALKIPWLRFDYIGVHAYTGIDDLTFGRALDVIEAHRAMWPDHPQLLTEFNIDKLEGATYRHAEGTDAVGNFLYRLTQLGYVKAAMWFLDDAHGDDQPYRLVRIPPLLDLFRRIGHERGDSPDPPPPSNGGTDLPDPLPLDAVTAYWADGRPADPGQALIKYPVVVNAGSDWIVELHESPGELEWRVQAPPDALVHVHTADNTYPQDGLGYAAVTWAKESAYKGDPPYGYWQFDVSAPGVARACHGENFGWRGNHDHFNVVVRRRTAGPPQPPNSDGGWSGAFAGYFRQHPEIGPAVGAIAYHPEPGAWVTCGQVSATHLLVWTGVGVVALSRR